MSLERKWSVPNKMRSTKITPYTPDNDFLSSAGIFLLTLFTRFPPSSFLINAGEGRSLPLIYKDVKFRLWAA